MRSATGVIVASIATILLSPLPAGSAHEPPVFLLDHEYEGRSGVIGKDVRVLRFRCKVVKDKGEYLATYKVKNLGKQTEISFSWEVTDLVANGSWARIAEIPFWWDVAPGEELLFTLRSTEHPVEHVGRLRVAEKARGDDKSWGKLFSGHGATLPPGPLWYVNTAAQTGPLPPSFLKRQKDDE